MNEMNVVVMDMRSAECLSSLFVISAEPQPVSTQKEQCLNSRKKYNIATRQ